MKRLYIVVEGQTEQEFVNTLLQPYFAQHGVYVVVPVLINTSKMGKGGFVNYQHLRNTVEGLLKCDAKKNAYVTTFVDFFRIPTSLPAYEKAMSLENDLARVAALEKAINKDLGSSVFSAYIQLHEFEALLFSDNIGFSCYFSKDVADRTLQIIDSYDNPEDINSGAATAPSKRILAIQPDYNKVLEGNVLALEIGIEKILERCPRFSRWINTLIDICK